MAILVVGQAGRTTRADRPEAEMALAMQDPVRSAQTDWALIALHAGVLPAQHRPDCCHRPPVTTGTAILVVGQAGRTTRADRPEAEMALAMQDPVRSARADWVLVALHARVLP